MSACRMMALPNYLPWEGYVLVVLICLSVCLYVPQITEKYETGMKHLPIASVCLNPFKPEFTIVIYIHYKPRIAVAIIDL